MFVGITKHALSAVFNLLLISASTVAWSHGAHYGELVIDHPYAVLSQDPLDASVYFRALVNGGEKTYRLTGAHTTVANEVKLQAETHTADHVIQWVTIKSVTIKPKTSMLFRHNHEQGYRILLTDLKHQINNGDTFPLTLTFEDGGQKTVDVWVQTPKIGKKTHTH